MEQTVTILLTPLDAETFKAFQLHHDLFLMLKQSGVFDIKFGKATLNFANGLLQTVSKEEIIYKRPAIDNKTQSALL